MDRYEVAEALFVIIGAIVAVAAIVLLIVIPIRQIDHHYSVKKCYQFQDVSSFQTKFVDYNYFVYECLAQRDDGKWVGADKLRESDNN